MYKRKRMSKRYSNKLYKKGFKTKKRNLRATPMRGGFRI